MGLIRENPFTGGSGGLYTVGLSRTVLVVGLGNIGREYEGTRHNVGFACVDAFAQLNGFSAWIEKKDLKCLFTSRTLGATRVIAIKPTTLMNLSGEAVQKAAAFYKIAPQHIVAVHDELDIPFGQIRTRVGGGSAGHNGIKSMTQHLGEGYGRIRVGIGPKTPEQMDSADFVLARFTAAQQGQMKALTQEVNVLLNEYIFGDTLPHDTRNFTL
jgi:peptidyl-tRNA hydrolase, PTH1 family